MSMVHYFQPKNPKNFKQKMNKFQEFQMNEENPRTLCIFIECLGNEETNIGSTRDGIGRGCFSSSQSRKVILDRTTQDTIWMELEQLIYVQSY